MILSIMNSFFLNKLVLHDHWFNFIALNGFESLLILYRIRKTEVIVYPN